MFHLALSVSGRIRIWILADIDKVAEIAFNACLKCIEYSLKYVRRRNSSLEYLLRGFGLLLFVGIFDSWR